MEKATFYTDKDPVGAISLFVAMNHPFIYDGKNVIVNIGRDEFHRLLTLTDRVKEENFKELK